MGIYFTMNNNRSLLKENYFIVCKKKICPPLLSTDKEAKYSYRYRNQEYMPKHKHCHGRLMFKQVGV